MLARTFLRCGGAFPLIGCGGVEDAESALAKIEAGASLVQIYTGMIYRGPGVIDEILDGLSRALVARRAAASPISSASARANGRPRKAEPSARASGPSRLERAALLGNCGIEAGIGGSSRQAGAEPLWRSSSIGVGPNGGARTFAQ